MVFHYYYHFTGVIPTTQTDPDCDGKPTGYFLPSKTSPCYYRKCLQKNKSQLSACSKGTGVSDNYTGGVDVPCGTLRTCLSTSGKCHPISCTHLSQKPFRLYKCHPISCRHLFQCPLRLGKCHHITCTYHSQRSSRLSKCHTHFMYTSLPLMSIRLDKCITHVMYIHLPMSH